MAVTTSRSGGVYVAKKKPFTWSYSRLKNFEVCPKRHYEIDLAKTYKEPENEVLAWGNRVHDALAQRCEKNVALPIGMEQYEHWAAKVCAGAEDGQGQMFVEQNLALTENFTSCGYFDHNTWFRAKVDAAKIIGDVALIADWKTGKILEDSVQLALTAACVFAKWPNVKAIRSTFIWLKEDAETSETFYPSDMPNLWRSLWPRIEALKVAYDTTTYSPVPSRMCRAYCAVKSCPNNGKSFP